MKKRFIFVICIVFCVFFVGIAKGFGANDIVINEIGATEPSGYEWIELYNRGASDVDLTGYKFFEDNVSHSLSLKQGSATLRPGEFALIAQDDVKLKQKYPNIFNTLFDSSWGSLNESGELIGLKDKNGNVLEQFMYVSSTQYSLERVDAKSDDVSTVNWKEHPDGNTLGGVNFASVFSVNDVPVQEAPPQDVSSTEAISEIVNDIPTVVSSTEDQIVVLPEVTSTESIIESTTSTSEVFEQNTVVETPAEEASTSTNEGPLLIYINEFVPQPLDDEKEWIEIRNDSLFEAVLINWSLEDATGKIASVSTTLGAKSFFVVELNSSKLNNGGDSLYLKNSEGLVVDEVHYGDGFVSSPQKGNSLARGMSGEIVETTTVTKGVENIITPLVIENEQPSTTNTSGEKPPEISSAKTTSTSKTSTKKVTAPQKEKIQEVDPKKRFVDPQIAQFVSFSELYPAPKKGEDEFIEILNSSSLTFDLSYFQIDDSEGGSKPFVFASGTQILPQQFLVISKKLSHISLNNTEESARILFPNGEVMEEVLYDDVVKGSSLVKNEKNEWVYTTAVTPGRQNTIVEVEEEPKKATSGSKQKMVMQTTIENLDDFQSGELVRIKGNVVTLPGVFGSQIFYVSDGRAVQVYMAKKDFPVLALGDEVEITGSVGVSAGETRVKVKTKKDIVVKTKNDQVPGEPIQLLAIDESLQGTLALVRGEITEKKSNYWFVDDGNGEIQVSFKKGANIDAQKIRVGDKVEVTGLVLNSKSSMQLFPRSQKDIVVHSSVSSTSEVVNSAQTNSSNKIVLIILGGLGAFLLGLFLKVYGNTIFSTIKQLVDTATHKIKQKKNLG